MIMLQKVTKYEAAFKYLLCLYNLLMVHVFLCVHNLAVPIGSSCSFRCDLSNLQNRAPKDQHRRYSLACSKVHDMYRQSNKFVIPSQCNTSILHSLQISHLSSIQLLYIQNVPIHLPDCHLSFRTQKLDTIQLVYSQPWQIINSYKSNPIQLSIKLRDDM